MKDLAYALQQALEMLRTELNKDSIGRPMSPQALRGVAETLHDVIVELEREEAER